MFHGGYVEQQPIYISIFLGKENYLAMTCINYLKSFTFTNNYFRVTKLKVKNYFNHNLVKLRKKKLSCAIRY